MKKFIIITLILGILASIIAGVSFYINDRVLLNNSIEELDQIRGHEGRKIFSAIKEFDKEESFEEEIKELYIKKLNGGLLLKKADYDGIRISKGQKQNISYSLKKGKLEIVDNSKETSGISLGDLFSDKYPRIVVYSKNPKELAATINKVNGAMSIETNIKELSIETINGALNIETTDSFNINIQEINGAASFDIKRLDAAIKISTINGAANLSSLYFDDYDTILPESIDQTIGNGRDTIEIGTVNGAISIDE